MADPEYHVVLLTLAESGPQPCTGPVPRAPVLACRDALTAAGATVELAEVTSDSELDEIITGAGTAARLVVGAGTDGQLRAVLRRLVRRYAPAPSGRPPDLPTDRTVPDLPAIGVLPLGPARDDLADRLRLPREPAAVARAVLGGTQRRLDLLRTDAGSVTAHGALVGTADGAWYGRVELDDIVLTDGTEPLLACAVANAGGSAELAGLDLCPAADPADGRLDVAVALGVRRRRWGRSRPAVEVRRAQGRACAVTPRDDVPYLDDGVVGTLGRKRTWWMERSAWAVYVP